VPLKAVRQSKLMQKLFKSPDSIFKYLTAAVLMVIILYPKFPFLRLPGIQVAIRLEDFLMVGVTAICGFYLLPKAIPIFSSKIEKAILVYLVVGFISLLSAIFLTKTVVPGVGILHWLRRIEYFAPFLLGILAIRKKENLGFYLKVLMLTLFIVFLYGLGQKYLHWPIIVTQNLEYAKGIALRWIPGSHINSTFAGHYDLATFLVLVLPIFISLFFLVRQLKTKIVLFILWLSGMWLLSAAVSRISVVSYLLASLTSLILIKKYKGAILVLGLSVVIFSFSSGLIARYGSVIEVIKRWSNEQRLLMVPLNIYAATEGTPTKAPRYIPTPTPIPIPVFEDRSSSIRLKVEWPRALRALSKNPLLGTGYSSITLATDNDYLRILGELGILGFGAFAAIIFGIVKILVEKLRSSWRNSTEAESAFLAGICGGVFGVLINAAFIDVFEASKLAIIFWLVMGILVGLIRKENYNE